MENNYEETKKIKLSKNFTLYELIKSPIASRKGINNIPNIQQIANLKLLTEKVLQPARDALGIPVIVSSGYRCLLLNRLIGGSDTSDHTKGKAADAELANGDNAKLFYYIKDNLEFDQLIWEFGDNNQPEWVHVSYRKGNNRRQVLKSIKKGGKTVYVPFN